MRTVVGIDPGLSGALCILSEGCPALFVDMPLETMRSGKNMVSAAGVCSVLAPYRGAIICLEEVHAMPSQGVTSMFNFGKAWGIVYGSCVALQHPVTLVAPQTWKKQFGLGGADKDFARTLAIQQFPALQEPLRRKKDGGRADAFWLAMLLQQRNPQT